MTKCDFLKKYFVVVLLVGCGIFSTLSARAVFAEGIDGLVKSLHSKDERTQLSAVDALGRLKKNNAIEALLDFVFIEAENWRVKIRAILLLGDIPDPRVSDRLVTIFNNPFLNEECPAMKWHTAMALGKDFNRGTRAVDSLIEALDYDNLLVREGVIRSLGEIGDPRAVPFLIPALTDRSFAIRFSTIRALERINDPRAIPYLRQAADKDKDAQIKETALSVLKKFKEDERFHD
jgi:HEAT repeat protein